MAPSVGCFFSFWSAWAVLSQLRAAISCPNRIIVYLQKRDPGRTFVLGERLSYILLPGLRTQDEAAEDPLTAAKAGVIRRRYARFG